MTGVVEALAERGDRPWVASNFPDLWENNPNVKGHLPAKFVRPMRRFTERIVHLAYEDVPANGRTHQQRMATLVGLPDTREYAPKIYLTDLEAAVGRAAAQGAVLIQTSAKTDFTTNKNWFADRFQRVANHCAGIGPVLQIGLPGGPALTGATDLRGGTSIREVAALLKAARLFIGLEGALMHLARAVGTPSVIVYGGFISPSQTGYASQENLFTKLECSPCLLETPCPYEMKCMRAISAEEVIARVDGLLNQKKAVS